MANVRQLAIAALLTTTATIASAASGSGTTTRYWDCCKPSCAWDKPDELISSVKSCSLDDTPLSGNNDQSGCAGGSAYMCSDQTPWQVDENTAYGFAAVSAASPACCQCYKLSFTSGPVEGKTMIVQATNTGGDVGSTQFDIAMPGGGFGIFDACTKQWGATPELWGAQYGGSSTNTCSKFPSALQPGCDWRWDWYQGADNPTVNWETVACPKAITDKSGCIRKGDTPTGSSASTPAKPAKPATLSSSTKANAAASASSSKVAAPIASSPSSQASPLPVEASAAGASSAGSQQVPESASTTFAVISKPSSPSVGSPSEGADIPTSAIKPTHTRKPAPEPTNNVPAPAKPSPPVEDDSDDDETCI